jgi:anionic cell wall polymer biosynthesis LytR-Cps2A-Psr (LCP) family protein
VRDINTGLEILNPGCVKLGGVQAREWVRARHLEYKRTGKWVSDESSDFGRISRQQDFIRRALKQAISKATNPLVASQLVQVATDNLKVDPNLDLIGLANRLRQLGSGTIDTYTLPNTPTVVQMPKLGKQDVLEIDAAAAAPILDYFRGASADAPTTAGATTSASASVPAAADTPTTVVAPAGGKGAAGGGPVVVPAIVVAASTPPSTTPAVGVLPDPVRQCQG